MIDNTIIAERVSDAPSNRQGDKALKVYTPTRVRKFGRDTPTTCENFDGTPRQNKQ